MTLSFVFPHLLISPTKWLLKLGNCPLILFNQMAFNPEVALFNLLEDAQTSEELLAVIDDYVAEDGE